MKCKGQVSATPPDFTLDANFMLSVDAIQIRDFEAQSSAFDPTSHTQGMGVFFFSICCEGNIKETYAEVSFVHNTARKSSGQPGRLPPPTLAPPQPPPPETIERPVGTGAMVARSSDLPYLIVGVVLGSIVLIIVTFIPFCLWRAWSKQSE